MIIPKNKNELKKLIKDTIASKGRHCNLNHIDVSQVTDMERLFSATSFNGDISGWDVSNVTNMATMFMSSHFNGDISRWNVSNVKDMTGMFYNSPFNGNIGQWNVSNVTNMRSMFSSADFNGDISNWQPYTANIANIFLNTPISLPYWAHYEDLQERERAINQYLLNKNLESDLKQKNYSQSRTKL